MKFLHISDLHIGKRVHEFSMIEDQKYIFKQILSIAQHHQTDAVIISGDIYDKPIPPAEAVQVFDYFLTELANLGKKVFAISGNHDSAERIAFGAQLMKDRGVFVSPVYQGTITKVSLTDEYGEIFLYLLPFMKPAAVRHALKEELGEHFIETYQEAVESVLNRIDVDKTSRNILLAHQFVTGAARCESEEIIVGGVDNIAAELFDDFDYAALGHIHNPQSVGRDTVRYCGTPLKYSFSEENQTKSVTIVELKEKGQITVLTEPLKPLHDMRIVRGDYLEVTKKSFYQDINTNDYIKVILTDEEDIPDGIQKLRMIYPNLMRLEYDNSRTRQNKSIESVKYVELKSDMELFEEFYELQNNQPMSIKQRDYVKQLMEELQEG